MTVRAPIDAVVKIGGALLRTPDALTRTLTALELVARDHRILIVPGGGPFADAVRTVDAKVALTDDDAHWMAILAMDQFAILLTSKMRSATLVHRPGEIARALARHESPVLAPYRWMREADPLPHSWDVTSDSIAAWIASQAGARQLILIKPDAHDPLTVVDRYFERARSPSLECTIVSPAMLTGSWFPA